MTSTNVVGGEGRGRAMLPGKLAGYLTYTHMREQVWVKDQGPN